MADSVRIELRFGQQVAAEALKILGNPHFVATVATPAGGSEPFCSNGNLIQAAGRAARMVT